MAARAAVSCVTINRLLGFETFLLDAESSKMMKAPAIDSTRPDGWQTETPSHTLLELPAEIAAHGFDCYDLTMLHLPSIERAYLADVRAAFEESNVEIFQLLIDTGEIGSPDPQESSAGIEHTKFWIEIAAELGASGVRYVPGDSEPTPETMPSTAAAFRELYDFAVERGLKPATENYRIFTNEADDLLRLVELSERDYGWIADNGNPKGSEKYDNLAKLFPGATSMHAWALPDEDGRPDIDEFRRCLIMARDSGFDGPIMLHGAYTMDNFAWAPDLWSGVEEMRAEVLSVFGENS
ncbi:MAG: TIM barrel protein [Chloroflexi bacterium]|nr:TIM barrel protein [Chloroflexota bacterium]